MAWIQALKKALRSLQKRDRVASDNQSGIALFMVIAAMTILSILVTEFTYIAQVNSRMAFDSLDQIKAHYLAKSGFKLSLLRLKAYKQVKEFVDKMGKDQKNAVSKTTIDKIWNFPFFYPFPTELPGLSLTDKDAIAKFQKESSLEGKFSAVIESESSKINLNSILPMFASTTPSTPPPSPTPGGEPTPPPTPTPSASPAAFNADEARQSLSEYFAQILENKFKDDPDFATEYRDFRLEEFMENLVAWADHTYEMKNSSRQVLPFKKAPFYSVEELRMIHPMDDAMYDLFSPNLTVVETDGINVNTIKPQTLRAFFPAITEEEIKAFYEFRDNPEQDNLFKAEEDFLKYIETNVAAYTGGQMKTLKENFAKRKVRFVTEEGTFKITVLAEVNQATRLIEAWVRFDDKDKKSDNQQNKNQNNQNQNQNQNQNPDQQPPQGGVIDPNRRPSSGLKISFMRIL